MSIIHIISIVDRLCLLGRGEAYFDLNILPLLISVIGGGQSQGRPAISYTSASSLFATRIVAMSETFPTSSTRTLCSARIPLFYRSPAQRAARVRWVVSQGLIGVTVYHGCTTALLPCHILPSYHKLAIPYPITPQACHHHTTSLSFHVTPSSHILSIPYTVPYHHRACRTILPHA